MQYELAAKHKSALYADPFLPLLNSKKILLPRNERAINQICSLERSMQRSGRDQITHPTYGHDDIANAIAGAADCARGASSYTLDPFQPDFVDLDARRPPSSNPPPSMRGSTTSFDYYERLRAEAWERFAEYQRNR